MKTQRIVAAVAAASLVMSSAAFAQSALFNDPAQNPNPAQNPRGPNPGSASAQNGQHGQPDTRGQYRTDQRNYDGHDNRGHDNRGHDNRGSDYRNYGYQEGGYRGHGRGAGPEQTWYRGDRLPTYYRSRSYVVDDWRGHHLYAPPQGYHWVQAGGDYVLAAIATGIIASILLNQ